MKKWEAIVQGIEILAEYNDSEYFTQAEHDQIFAGEEDVSAADDAILRALGWIRDYDECDRDGRLTRAAGLWYINT